MKHVVHDVGGPLQLRVARLVGHLRREHHAQMSGMSDGVFYVRHAERAQPFRRIPRLPRRSNRFHMGSEPAKAMLRERRD